MSLSMEEFQRLQQTMMQLKTDKYAVDDQLRRAQTELESVRAERDNFEKQAAKALKVIAKSKKHKELQSALDSHENEIAELQIQNKGLLDNLNEISLLNETLQKKLDACQSQSSDTVDTEALREVEKQLSEVQAASQTQAKAYQQDIAGLKESVARLEGERSAAEAKYFALLERQRAEAEAAVAAGDDQADTDSALGNGGEAESVGGLEGNNAPNSEGMAALRATWQQQLESLLSKTESEHAADSGDIGSMLGGDIAGGDIGAADIADVGGDLGSSVTDGPVAASLASLHDAIPALLDLMEEQHIKCAPHRPATASPSLGLRHRVETLVTANKELTEHVRTAEERASAATQERDRNEKRAQQMEQQVTELKEQLSSATSGRQEQVAKLQEQVAILSDKVQKKQASFLALQEEKEQVFVRNKDAMQKLQSEKDAAIAKLSAQLEASRAEVESAAVAVKQMEADAKVVSQNEELQRKLSSVQDALGQRANELAEARRLLTEQEAVAKALRAERAQLSQDLDAKTICLDELEQGQEDVARELANQTTLAESRKDALDELAKDKQDLITEHQKTVAELATEKDAEIAKLQEDNAAQAAQLQQQSKAVARERKQRETLQEAHTATEEQLKEAVERTEQLEDQVQTLEARVEELTEAAEKAADDAKEAIAAAEQDSRKTVAALEAQVQEQEERIKQLSTTLDDATAERDIVEKKGAALMKDLKRQLKSEQKRVGALESDLAEARRREVEMSDQRSDRQESTPSRGHRRTPSIQSVASSSSLRASRESLAEPLVSDQEHAELIRRISSLQAERADLIEKINLLQARQHDLKAELQQKTEIIGHFFSAGAGGQSPGPSAAQMPHSPKKVSKKKDVASLQDMNSRMQTIVEETLLKNIQLQKMVESLSAEGAAPAVHSPPVREEDKQTRL
eukprot:m.313610 g.313610  ORF g.313610 m.313610 type:complete len:921 (+) comp19664_c0_seq11:345-3107(+)